MTELPTKPPMARDLGNGGAYAENRVGEAFKRHLQGLNLQVGQTVALTTVQLKQILGLAVLPPFTSL